jgi:uncharacterized protein (TIGR02996 family)
MSDVVSMVKAVVANPQDHTAILALADALDERHAAGADGRATVLRKYVAGQSPQGSSPKPHIRPLDGEYVNYYEHIPEGGGHYSGVSLNVNLSRSLGMRESFPAFDILLSDNGRLNHTPLVVPVTHEEARDIADNLPNAKRLHAALDRHFGPDPRQYAKAYSAAVRK